MLWQSRKLVKPPTVKGSIMRYLKSIVVVISLFVAMSAQADESFRKGGEWQSTVTGIGPQPQTIVMCFSQVTWEQAMAKLAAGKCTKKDISKNGDLITIDLVCGMIAMQGTATLSGDTAYKADMTMRMRTGANANVVHSLTESTWIGACKPGERVMN